MKLAQRTAAPNDGGPVSGPARLRVYACVRSFRFGLTKFAVWGLALVFVMASLSPPVWAQRPSKSDANTSAYSLPQVDEVHLQSYEDFKKYLAAREWSRAFRSIAAQLDQPPRGCLPVDEGTAFSWRLRVWRDLAEMSGVGRRAFRLFHDARVKKALSQAVNEEDANRKREQLERLYYSFFITRFGDDVAYELAKVAMAEGRPAQARGYLEAIFEYHLDSDLELAPVFGLHLKALAATADAETLEEAAEYAEERCGEEEFEIDGAQQTLRAYAKKLIESQQDVTVARQEFEEVDFGDDAERRWNIKLDPIRSSNTRSWIQVLAADLPDACVHRGHIYINHAGILKCYDTATGVPVWTKGSTVANQQGILNDRCFIEPVPGKDQVLYLSPPGLTFARKGKDQIRMKCLDGVTGDTIWSTRTQDGTRHHTLVSRPVVAGNTVFVAGCPRGVSKLELLALDLDTGELKGSMELGSPARVGSNRFFWMGRSMPALMATRPTLLLRGNTIYVLTDGGAVLAVDWGAQRLLWAHFYPFSAQKMQGSSPASGIIENNVLYFRARGLNRLMALDLNTGDRLWARPCRWGESLVGMDKDRFYLMDRGMRALDRETRSPLWSSTTLRRGSGPGRVVQTEDALLVVRRQNICRIDKQSGNITKSWDKVLVPPTKPEPKVNPDPKAKAESKDDPKEDPKEKVKKAKKRLRVVANRRKNPKQTQGGSVFVVGDAIYGVCASGVVCVEKNAVPVVPEESSDESLETEKESDSRRESGAETDTDTGEGGA